MASFEFKFLGDLEVIREGSLVKLPPSKKTRALLAYLALNDRAFRREHLCELLWEIPDDPRGSLRWSLSKLRRVVDEVDLPRIVADRTNVSLDTSGTSIDITLLSDLVAGDLAGTSVETLELAAGCYRGNFLEGLELPNFHDFHAWCIAERESAVQAQATLLNHLLQRLSADPARALSHARSLVGIAPYDETARAGLIRLLVEVHRTDEAEQQYQLGERMLEEIGVESTGELYKSWRGDPGVTSQEESTPPVADPAPRAQVRAPVAAVDLIGREVESRLLQTVFDRVVAENRAATVLIRGEPGIGKSRLLEWLMDQVGAMGALVLEASAFESETMRPYSLWIDALRRRGSAEAVFGDDDRDNRDRLFGGLSEFVRVNATTGPVVLLFDDVQWSDESSMAALHYVLRMNRQLPVFAVLAVRDGELQDNAAVQQALRGLRHDGRLEEIQVGPLSEEAVRRLIAARSPDVDSSLLSQECGGNPLLAIELARAEAEGDQGGSLDELVRERLARFDVDGGEVLRWAAVLSPRITTDALVQATGLDANRVGSILEMAEREAMLRPADQGFRFAHDLIARGVYTEIAPARRSVMHRRIAEMVEATTSLDLEHAADLAHHALASAEPGLGARSMVSSGRLCLRFFANDDALVLARKGLQLAAQLSDAEHVCRRLELFDVMLSAGPVYDWQAAADEYSSLAEQALDHGELSHARLGYHMASYVRWANGNWSGAQEETLQAERVTRGASEEEHVIGMAETAKCLAMLERDLSQAEAMLMEAKALSKRSRINYHAIPAALGLLRYHEGKLDESEELLKEARTQCKSAGDRVNEFQANEYLVMIELERGQLEAASKRCEALIEIGDKLREGSEAPFAHAVKGLCRYGLEDEPGDLEAGLQELRVADAKHRLSYTLTRAALIDLERGRRESAIARASEALGYAAALERASEMLLAHEVLAAAYSGHDATAHQHHTAALAEFEGTPAAARVHQRDQSNRGKND